MARSFSRAIWNGFGVLGVLTLCDAITDAAMFRRSGALGRPVRARVGPFTYTVQQYVDSVTGDTVSTTFGELDALGFTTHVLTETCVGERKRDGSPTADDATNGR